MSRAYLCVSIDTEADEDGTLEGVTDGVVRRIHPLFERFCAKPTYLLSPEVLAAEAGVTVFRALASSCDLGTLGRSGGDLERTELTAVTDHFIRAVDYQPQSFRARGSALGPASIGTLESLGYAVDASVTPHTGPFEDAPTQPYRPDPSNPGREGDASILEVPLTSRRRLLSALPAIGRRMRPQRLQPTQGTAARLVRIAEDEIAAARRHVPGRPVFLHATFRNIDVVPRASAFASNEEKARGVLDGLRALLLFARSHAISVVGLADVPEILASARGASSSVP